MFGYFGLDPIHWLIIGAVWLFGCVFPVVVVLVHFSRRQWCPSCNVLIPKTAVKCKYCGARLKPPRDR
jgi:hypothetical protein